MSSTTDIYTVYQIKNLVNNKVYIGITTRDPEYRWNQHKKLYQKRDFILYKAMRKYGLENFRFSILEKTHELTTLNNLEIKYIKEYNSYAFQENSNGYNMTLGGDGVFGFKHSNKTKILLSEIGKTQIFSIEHRRKLSESGKKRVISETHKKNLSKSLAGRKLSEAHKKNISEAIRLPCKNKKM